jgi:hypothetical protein
MTRGEAGRYSEKTMMQRLWSASTASGKLDAVGDGEQGHRREWRARWVDGIGERQKRGGLMLLCPHAWDKAARATVGQQLVALTTGDRR